MRDPLGTLAFRTLAFRTLVLAGAALALCACRAPYASDVAYRATVGDPLPQAGTPAAELADWFAAQGYLPGPRVRQSIAELARAPGDPLVYAVEADREWWLTQSRSIRALCVTQKTVYFQLDPAGALLRAVQNHRAEC